MKYRFALLIILLQTCLVGLAQKQVDLAKLEQQLVTAQKLLLQGTGESSEKALALFLSTESSLNQVIAELESSSGSQDAATLLALGRFRLNCVTGIAATYSMRGRRDLAIQKLEEAIPFHQRLKDKFGTALLKKALAEDYQQIGKLQLAKSHFESALELLESDPKRYLDFIHYSRLSYYQCLEALGLTDDATIVLDELLRSGLERERGKRRDEILQAVHFGRGFFFLRHGLVNEAEKELEALVALPLVQQSPVERFGALLALMSISQKRQDLEAWESTAKRAKQAQEEAERAGHTFMPSELGVLEYSLATLWYFRHDFEKALAHLRLVDEYHQKSGLSGLSPGFTTELYIYREQGRADELMPRLETYLHSLKQPTPEDLSLHLTFVRELSNSGQPDRALKELETVLETIRRLENKPLLVKALKEAANTYDYYQVPEQAERYYTEALKLAVVIQDKEEELDLEAALFRLRIRTPEYLQDHRAVLDDFLRLAGKFDAVNESGTLSTVLSGYASELLAQQRFQAAGEILDVMGQLVGGKSTTIDSFLVYGRSSLDRQQKRLELGPAHIARVREQIETADSVLLANNLREELLRWKIALGVDLEDDPEFEAYFKEAPPPEDTERLLHHYLLLAKIAEHQNDVSEFLRNLNLAENLLWSSRRSVEDRAFRGAYGYQAAEIYRLLVGGLVDDGQLGKAFSAAERSRGQTLALLFQRTQGELSNLATPAQRAQLDALFSKRDEIEQKLLSSQGKEAEDFLGLLTPVVQEIDSILEEIASVQGRGESYHGRTEVSAESVQKALKPNQVLLRYFVAREGPTHLFIVPSEGPIRVSTLPSANELMSAIQKYRKAIRHQSSSVARLRAELGKIVFQGVPLGNDEQEIIVVPDGPFYFLPFSTLLSADGIPLYQHKVSIVPSARFLSRQTAAKSSVGSEMTVFADPTFSDQNALESTRSFSAATSPFEGAPNALPGTALEAELIEKVCAPELSVNLFEGVEASKDNLFQLSETGKLAKSKIVHFATHGYSVSTDPRLSGLVLSLVDKESRPKNGYLRLVDIYQLKLNAQLVVLSACDTGLGTIRHGDGLLGLYQGFLMAGSEQVLNTLWSVDDDATAEFMNHFYGALVGGKTAKEALSEAQQIMATSKRWSAPYYWGAFQLVAK